MSTKDQVVNKSRKNKASSSERDGLLGRYFQEMSEGSLLTAKEEAKLAEILRGHEENIWAALLSNPKLVAFATKFLQEELGERSPSFKELRASVTRHRRQANKGSLENLKRRVGITAADLRIADPDQEVLNTLCDELFKERAPRAYSKELGITKSEVQAIAQALRKAKRSALAIRNQFVERNLGLVVSVARRYRFSGMPLSDLIQEGNLGLLKAVSRFDERKGFRFSTYATWWIRHGIGRAVADKSRTVRVPVHVMEAQQKIRKLEKELSGSLGRTPNREELAKAVGMPLKKLESTLESAQGYSTSLDDVIGEDRDRQRLEVFTTSESKDSAFEQLATHGLSQRAFLAMDRLAPIEQEIIHRRFGLAGNTATTLQEIAQTIGKSRERIRQIQEKALAKLRDSLVAEQAI